MPPTHGSSTQVSTTATAFEEEITQVSRPRLGYASARFFNAIAGGAEVSVDVRLDATNQNSVRIMSELPVVESQRAAALMRRTCATAGIHYALEDMRWYGALVQVTSIDGGRSRARSVAVAMAAARATYIALGRPMPEDLYQQLQNLDFMRYARSFA